MSATRAIILTLLCAALTAGLMWLWLSTREPIGLAGALFFGSGVLLLGSFIQAAPIPPPSADGSITIPVSTIRCLFATLACAAIIAASFIAIPALAGSDDWRKYAFFIIPAPLALLVVRYLQWAFSSRPAYRIDNQGITRLQWGERHVAWKDVTDIRVWVYRNQQQLALDLTPEAKRALPWWSQLGSALGAGDLTLSAMPAGIRPLELEAIVRAFWRRNKRA